MKTLKILSDLKFDLVTPRALNSNKFKLNGLEDPEKYPQKILIQ